MSSKVPILFLTFNRLETTKKVFSAIREYKPSRLYIASDGPRANKHGEAEKVSVVRQFLTENIDWECEINTRFQEKNLGCKYGVSTSITWFFEQEKHGIILEDDCLPNIAFFEFCEHLLAEYESQKTVSMISGGNFAPRAIKKTQIDIGYDFSKYSIIWGWATWADRWLDRYDAEMSDWWQIKQSENFCNSFNTESERKYWYRIFDKMAAKEIDTWDYQWHYCNLKENRLSIIPVANYISNIGAEIDPTHNVQKTEVHDRNLEEFHSISKRNTLPLPTQNKEYDKVIANLFFNKTILRRVWLKANKLFKVFF